MFSKDLSSIVSGFYITKISGFSLSPSNFSVVTGSKIRFFLNSVPTSDITY